MITNTNVIRKMIWCAAGVAGPPTPLWEHGEEAEGDMQEYGAVCVCGVGRGWGVCDFYIMRSSE